MTILTRQVAEAERERLLADVRHHRREAARRLRDLERLEADCARVGIRLIRVPVRGRGGPETYATRPDPDDR